MEDNGSGISSLARRKIDASILPRHEGSNLARAAKATAGLDGEMFAQNVINGETGRIKGFRITAEFER